jgi:hypothetical protein
MRVELPAMRGLHWAEGVVGDVCCVLESGGRGRHEEKSGLEFTRFASQAICVSRVQRGWVYAEDGGCDR